MEIDYLSNTEGLPNRSRHYPDTNWNKFGKITTYLVSNSSPMTRSDKVGLTLTVIAFGIILFPFASSDSDPYHIKWLLDELTENISFIEDVRENNDSHYRVIVHLKISQESQLDSTEKIILGKYRSFSN